MRVVVSFTASLAASVLLIQAQQVSAFSTPKVSKSFVPHPYSLPSVARRTSPTLWASSINTTAKEEEKQKSPKVRRKYETFLWFHEMDEYDINYRVEGPSNGPPILLVHGFGANVNHFRYQFPALVEAGFRVYAVDLLGFGASPKAPDANYSIELFVQLLKDFMQTMHTTEKKEWIVAGNSIGGLCSLAVAEELPDLVRGVVLFNCAGGMTGFRYEDVPIYARPILYFVQKVVLGPQWGGRFFKGFKTRENVESSLRAQGVYRDPTNINDELLEILLEPGDDEGAETVFLKTFAGPPGPTPESILPNLSCPVFALWGGADPWTPVDAGMHPGTEFHNYAKNSDFELVVLPNVGHCPHDEVPDLVNAHMISWIQGLEEGSQQTKKE
jgi:pimeloyl-ACP methyl ester carboxylesterase